MFIWILLTSGLSSSLYLTAVCVLKSRPKLGGLACIHINPYVDQYSVDCAVSESNTLHSITHPVRLTTGVEIPAEHTCQSLCVSLCTQVMCSGSGWYLFIWRLRSYMTLTMSLHLWHVASGTFMHITSRDRKILEAALLYVSQDRWQYGWLRVTKQEAQKTCRVHAEYLHQSQLSKVFQLYLIVDGRGQ